MFRNSTFIYVSDPFAQVASKFTSGHTWVLPFASLSLIVDECSPQGMQSRDDHTLKPLSSESEGMGM